MRYAIILDHKLPAYDQLRGWRRFTNFLFGIPVRPRVVIRGPEGRLFTNPSNVDAVRRYLDSMDAQYDVYVQLESLQGGKQ